jgi:hypothetical protein
MHKFAAVSRQENPTARNRRDKKSEEYRTKGDRSQTEGAEILSMVQENTIRAESCDWRGKKVIFPICLNEMTLLALKRKRNCPKEYKYGFKYNNGRI